MRIINSVASSGKTAILLLWVPLIIWGLLIGVASAYDYKFFSWLFEHHSLNEAKFISTLIFGALSGWLFMISVWFGIISIKTLAQKKYPPGNIPIPYKTEALIGKKAVEAGLTLFVITLVTAFMGGILAYSQYISNSTGL